MGGPVIWVERAFSPMVAHHNAVVHLVANFFDTALYPVRLADYLHEFHPALRLDGVQRVALEAVLLLGVTLLNIAGVDAVANISTLFTVLVVSPFAALVLAGLPTLDPSAWLIGPAPTDAPLDLAAAGGDGGGGGGIVRWGVFLSVLLWNTSGYDSVGVLAAEVENPGRDFPRAMIASIVLISLVYVLPVGVGVSLDDREMLPTWADGTLARVASDHVGGWLAS